MPGQREFLGGFIMFLLEQRKNLPVFSCEYNGASFKLKIGIGGLVKLVTLFLCLLFANSARSEFKPQLFEGLSKNIVDSFSGVNLIYHFSAFAVTPSLVTNGVDGRVYEHFRKTPNDLTWPGAILASGVGALVGGVWLYKQEDPRSVGAAYLIAQTSAITVSYVILLKTLTGRAHPTNTWHLSPQEQSEQYSGFNQLRYGYGWPSGHMSHTVAVTTALATYYPEKNWLKWFSLGASAYMLYTVSAHNSAQMHWFSDGVAGAFVGYAIGTTVGRNFRQQYEESSASTKVPSSTSLLPIASSEYFGVSLLHNF